MSKSVNAAPLEQRGFSLLELMIAMVITLVITGAMWGLAASGQNSFRREPALMDRQQQVRIAIDRIEEDVLAAGMGLGPFWQAFAENLGGENFPGGILGVRPLNPAPADQFGVGTTDALEIRSQNADCPPIRTLAPAATVAGTTYNLAAGEAVLAWGPPAKPADACYQAGGWVVAQFADGNAKWGWRNQPAGISFTGQPADAGFNKGSQMGAAIELACSLPTVAGVCALPGNPIEASTFGSLDRIRYQIALDPVDLVPSLYRSATGGFNPATAGFLPPPNPLAWQLVARGIEDLQVRYRTFGGWQGSAPMINPAAAVGVRFDNIVREVEVTLWARTVGEGKLVGETTAANGAVAVRGSAVTSIAPRAAQIALMNETVLAKRWQ